VTESVVLPPIYCRGGYAPIFAVNPAAAIARAMDERDCRRPHGLVVFDLVYLAGPQWPSLIRSRRKGLAG
jgi:hypothetical protein